MEIEVSITINNVKWEVKKFKSWANVLDFLAPSIQEETGSDIYYKTLVLRQALLEIIDSTGLGIYSNKDDLITHANKCKDIALSALKESGLF